MLEVLFPASTLAGAILDNVESLQVCLEVAMSQLELVKGTSNLPGGDGRNIWAPCCFPSKPFHVLRFFLLDLSFSLLLDSLSGLGSPEGPAGVDPVRWVTEIPAWQVHLCCKLDSS